jgi:hypothetical protein
MRRVVVIALGGLALVAAGCGGERLTQAQFEAKTQAICAGYTKLAQREIPQLGINPNAPNATAVDVARFGRAIERIRTLFGRQLDDLRRVWPPAQSASQYRRVLVLYAQIENALGRAAKAARQGDRLGIARIEREFGALGAQVDALGFRCE